MRMLAKLSAYFAKRILSRSKAEASALAKFWLRHIPNANHKNNAMPTVNYRKIP